MFNDYDAAIVEYRTGIGAAVRRFLPADTSKPCVIAGVIFEEIPGLAAHSDGDIAYHAICNALSSIGEIDILNEIAEPMLQREGITESKAYLRRALEVIDAKVTHVALAFEGKRPLLREKFPQMRESISRMVGCTVGMSAISGEGLSAWALGEGIRCTALVTVELK